MRSGLPRSLWSAAILLVSSAGCGPDPFFSSDPVTGPPCTEGCQKPCALGAKVAGYPTTGCGTAKDDVIDAFEWTGKDASKGGAAAPTETLRLADLHDPDGKAGRRFLVMSVSALWCVACKDEAKKLPLLRAQYGSKGVIFATDLAQDGTRNPSADKDLDLWITAFKLDTWVVHDKDFVLSRFFDPSSMPLNMIIDLRTMKIVVIFTGASLEKIQSELDKRL